MTEHFDVVIIGGGLSGVSAAHHLRTRCPDKTFVVLERRAALGGTWDLFRYPGVRSDSDMYTLGYRWKPWLKAKAIADGPDILEYVRETARENGVDEWLRVEHRVTRGAWSSERARWTLDVEQGPNRRPIGFTCSFVFVCAGYYDYDAGYTPEFEGREEFGGRVVHPQHWTEDIEYEGKRVVVIGSGATAMSLVPALAKKAAHVVLLQRSPTYVVSLPAVDPVANLNRTLFPPRLAYALTRLKNVTFGLSYFQLSRRFPKALNALALRGVRRALGPDFDIEKHFTPRYNLWDQRVCLVPDRDLFVALRSERASIVTDHIERFTPRGLRLRSGEELAADLIVTATGLELSAGGGVEWTNNGRPIDLTQSMGYKGCMFTDVPNAFVWFGYTNASWTLKADLTSEYACRLLAYMQAKGMTSCTPRLNDPTVQELPWLDFTSGYVQRGSGRMPKQGSKRPFRLYQNYLLDLLNLRFGKLDDGVLEFASAQAASVRSNDTHTHERSAQSAQADSVV